ncbi:MULTISPECIES: DUF4190 domain-containing protein [Pontibacillus]|uniref:DUF4190 domain-containing protein n=1 Tax=Pontibacillus chungwhensis TaxID=265426 RepID=A0ABY8UTG6_9BACI|nr:MULTISPECIES: DUF4190 domain-containing protein [Pontibacillus]MCD5323593.1 DUF4190 domain-containing protein [Pontibacillus sp. HN14]WIF96962.1 DUF4190 domain-containing protein [Pontibacillus chungwhensis]
MEHEDKREKELDDIEHTEEAPRYGDEQESEMKKIDDGQSYDEAYNEVEVADGGVYAGTGDVEFAQEAAVDAKTVREPIKSNERESDMDNDVHAGMGWLAVVLSVVSFFILPVILGAAGIIVGFMARRRGAETLGNTAIVAGAISVVLTLVFAPF